MSPIDFDALPAVDVDVPAFYNNEQFSREAQLLIDTGPFNGLIGLYYLDASARTVFDVRLPGIAGTAINSLIALTLGDVDTDTVAVFGDFTYDLTSQFSVSVGGRYTWEDRRSSIFRYLYQRRLALFRRQRRAVRRTDVGFPRPGQFREVHAARERQLQAQPRPHAVCEPFQGLQGGGFDPRGQSTACRTATGGLCNAQQVHDFLSFDPETVDSYEVGYKAALLDRRVTLALAGFHADYRDVQVPGSQGVTLNGQQTFIGITTNAGKARINATEAEVNATLAQDLAGTGDRLTFAGTLGYLDAKYTTFVDARGINVANRPITATRARCSRR